MVGSPSRARPTPATCSSRQPGEPARETGPLRAFSQRIAAKRGSNIATVAVARKLVVIAWHMLARDEEYAFVRPSLVRQKVRRLELLTGAERHPGKRTGVFASRDQHRFEKELAAQAEVAYERLVKDWVPSRKNGAGSASGARISRR